MVTNAAQARRDGFALVELIAAAAVVGLLAAVLVVLSSDSRRKARLAGSLSNLQEFAVGTQAYAADNADRFWTFTWRAGVDYGFGGIATFDVEAAANQAVFILRTRGGLSDLQPVHGWLPHLSYNQLVLAEYLDQPLPTKTAVSPEDLLRLGWQAGAPGPGGGNRWRFSSSYEPGPAFWSPDAQINGVPTVQQHTYPHRLFSAGNESTRLGTRRMAEVVFPSQKAMIYENFQRSFGARQPYFMYEEARLPVLSADGGAAVRSTSDANVGFIPNSPLDPSPTMVVYTPDVNWESPPLNGFAQELVIGHYRWTRSGLRGRDFGGPEVPWSPP